jgi:RNA polymerase sigma-70 factor (ECF subfamily)
MSIADAEAVSKENQLIAEAVQGSSEAFGQLVRSYQGRLFTTVTHIVRSREEAEDVVQDAFVQAYVKLPTFRGTSCFYTWVYRIAVNMALSRGRKRRNRRTYEIPVETMPPDAQDPGESPVDRLLRKEHATEIKRALAALSKEHRAILVLRGVDGFDYHTIGRILGLSPGTVRSRLHRARTQLRARLEENRSCHA